MTSQYSAPARTDPCPRTPEQVPDAVDTAVASRSALAALQRQRDTLEDESTTYRRLVAEYDHRLAESLDDQARLRTEMRAFGQYLRAGGVRPEHIVLCVHDALRATDASRDLFALGNLGPDIVKWTIEGYYGADAAGEPWRPDPVSVR